MGHEMLWMCPTQQRRLVAIVALALFLMVFVSFYSTSIKTSVMRWVDVPTTLPVQKLRRCLNGVVTVVPGGRFGNAFMELASAWAVARKHNLTLATPTVLRQKLQSAFRRVPLGLSLAETLSACPRAPTHAAHRAPPTHGVTAVAQQKMKEEEEEEVDRALYEEDVFSLQVKNSDVPDAAAALTNALAAHAIPGPLVVRRYAVLSRYIIPLAKELRAKVEWQDHLREKAQEKLHFYGKATAEIVGEPVEKVVFVGVHVRRTDYPQWLRRNNTTLEADAAFYKRAITRLRRDLDNPKAAGGAAGSLALVVVSDDMPWVRDVLLPELTSLAQKSGRMAAFAGGAGDEGSTLEDLALLASCNHTVYAYGTYGMTAALLAGGRVVAFKLRSTYASSIAARFDSRWVLLR